MTTQQRFKRLTHGVTRTIKNSIERSHLLTSEEERKGCINCPNCQRTEWFVFSPIDIECSYCKNRYNYYGSLGMVKQD